MKILTIFPAILLLLVDAAAAATSGVKSKLAVTFQNEWLNVKGGGCVAQRTSQRDSTKERYSD
jgi:hypothetical protein